MSDGQLQSQDVVKQILATTPARLLVGRSGPAYRTETWLKLRADHAAARDTVYAELDLLRDFGEDQLNSFQLFRVQTQAKTKSEYLMRPDLGRRLDDDSREMIARLCPKDVDLQVVIGDGLSSAAVASQGASIIGSAQPRSEPA